MNYLQQLSQSFAQQLIRPRKYNYSQQILQSFFLDNPHLHYRFSKIPNKRQQHLETLLVKKHINNLPSKTCIIYAHGLGSNKLQVLSILKHLKEFPYDVCSFDFSGSGKSEGKYTSYGLREKDDVCAVLAWLDQIQHYDEYVLWGRSMGSVAIILSQGLLLNPKVSSIILDSPFSSFEKVSLQIASKKSFIPQLFLQPLLSYLKEYFSKKADFNPFTVKVEQSIKKINRKILFIYSRNDTVVNFSHSINLKKSCKQLPQELQIEEDHNMQRSKQTHLKVYAFMVKNSFEKPLLRQYESSDGFRLDQTMKFEKFEFLTNRGKSISKTNRGISVTSKDSIKQNIQSESNRGRKSTENSNGKINLVITQSIQLHRKNSIKESYRQTKLKPSSSIKLGHHHSQIKSSMSMIQKSTPKYTVQPASLISFSSIDTVQSNNDQQPGNHQNYNSNEPELINKFYFPQNNTVESMTATIRFGSHINSSGSVRNVLQNNYVQGQNQKQKQLNYLQKLNTFYSASFMDQNLNLLCSINSICLNRKKDKENIAKEPTPTLFKEKTPVYGTSATKRPSIQLRRKNRFVI